MLLPDSMELRICVPYNSRSTAWASFDGRGRVELRRKRRSLSPPANSLLISSFDSQRATTSRSRHRLTPFRLSAPTSSQPTGSTRSPGRSSGTSASARRASSSSRKGGRSRAPHRPRQRRSTRRSRRRLPLRRAQPRASMRPLQQTRVRAETGAPRRNRTLSRRRTKRRTTATTLPRSTTSTMSARTRRTPRHRRSALRTLRTPTSRRCTPSRPHRHLRRRVLVRRTACRPAMPTWSRTLRPSTSRTTRRSASALSRLEVVRAAGHARLSSSAIGGRRTGKAGARRMTRARTAPLLFSAMTRMTSLPRCVDAL